MKIVILLLLLIASVFSGHHSGHKCTHDKIQERLDDREISIVTLDDEAQRNLQSSSPRKMKITYDMSFFNNLADTPDNKDFKKLAEKAIKIAISYFSELLTIIPKPAGTMKWNKKTTKFDLVTIPKADIDNDKDSDLHLYISYTNESDETYLAYANQCRFLKNFGPFHGYVNFNKAKLDQIKNLSNSIAIQDLIQTTIHEIIHVLGFSIYDIRNWVDSNKNLIQNQLLLIKSEVLMLLSFKLQMFKRLQGLTMDALLLLVCLLKTQEILAGSHWKTTTIQNEIINSIGSTSNSIMSVFTIALLKDTGFFASVNDKFVEPSYYGKDQGCGFITGECDTTKREFCKSGSSYSCDFYNHGRSHCTEGDLTDQGCSNWEVISNFKCVDENNYLNKRSTIKKHGVGFGQESKCFMSFLTLKSYIPNKQAEARCFVYKCTADQRITVNIGSEKLICSKNGEKLTLNGYNGEFMCPEKLEEFCGFKKTCPKNCSNNGYCVNGTCVCGDSKKTDDCP